MRTTVSQVIADQIACQMLTKQGTACGKPGQQGLPAGVCTAHAVEIFRAVSRLVETQRTEEAR